jgi:hypothetical protein
MSNGNKCHPDYWFLKGNEKVEITLAETGVQTVISESQLLDARFGRMEAAEDVSC